MRERVQAAKEGKRHTKKRKQMRKQRTIGTYNHLSHTCTHAYDQQQRGPPPNMTTCTGRRMEQRARNKQESKQDARECTHAHTRIFCRSPARKPTTSHNGGPHQLNDHLHRGYELVGVTRDGNEAHTLPLTIMTRYEKAGRCDATAEPTPSTLSPPAAAAAARLLLQQLQRCHTAATPDAKLPQKYQKTMTQITHNPTSLYTNQKSLGISNWYDTQTTSHEASQVFILLILQKFKFF